MEGEEGVIDDHQTEIDSESDRPQWEDCEGVLIMRVRRMLATRFRDWSTVSPGGGFSTHWIGSVGAEDTSLQQEGRRAYER